MSGNQPATPGRQRRARNAGLAPRSHVLVHASTLAALLVSLSLMGEDALAVSVTFVRDSTLRALSTSDPTVALAQMVDVTLFLAAPLSLVLVTIVAVQWLQARNPIGWPHQRPQPRRVAWTEAGLAFLGGALLTCGGAALFVDQLGTISRLPRASTPVAAEGTRRLLLQLSWSFVALLLLSAAIEFMWRRYAHRRALRMSRAEVRREQERDEVSARLRAALRPRESSDALGHGDDVPR